MVTVTVMVRVVEEVVCRTISFSRTWIAVRMTCRSRDRVSMRVSSSSRSERDKRKKSMSSDVCSQTPIWLVSTMK